MKGLILSMNPLKVEHMGGSNYENTELGRKERQVDARKQRRTKYREDNE